VIRYERLDAVRGFALVWMAVFHFCFDLAHLGLTKQNFYTDPFWTQQRLVIVSLFLLCAGVGQALAQAQGVSWQRFVRRWGQVAVCALVVSVASWWIFPRSYISFGVLHAMAVMMVLTRLVAPLGWRLWPLGAVLWVLPMLVRHPFFDHRATNWVGLVTRKPLMEDYVPLLPWWALMVWGLALGQYLLARHPRLLSGGVGTPIGGLNTVFRGLATLGRYSLSFYMVHQPVFWGLLLAWLWLSGAWGGLTLLP
jgi:uncharacterized membrane protein